MTDTPKQCRRYRRARSRTVVSHPVTSWRPLRERIASTSTPECFVYLVLEPSHGPSGGSRTNSCHNPFPDSKSRSRILSHSTIFRTRLSLYLAVLNNLKCLFQVRAARVFLLH
ncbi:hypothetical protein ATANTOWER_023593 [Ataeniobius toweri]|uniref:Uncharacterized protein n=1 Tax=Ataeniobius toweri TaxID=208326 RepID=A0ABU7CB39_9TELE|nr:hypothetical protein [Ataeniobius toweri]